MSSLRGFTIFFILSTYFSSLVTVDRAFRLLYRMFSTGSEHRVSSKGVRVFCRHSAETRLATVSAEKMKV